jgi:hypothetical protein
MLVDIMNNGMDDALSRMRKELPQMKSAEDRIDFIVRAQITFYVKNKSQTKASIYEMETRLDVKHEKAMDKKQLDYVGFVRRAVEQIIRENPYITIKPAIATYSLLGMLNWMVHWYDPEGKVSPEELASSITRIFLHGLKSRAAE